MRKRWLLRVHFPKAVLQKNSYLVGDIHLATPKNIINMDGEGAYGSALFTKDNKLARAKRGYVTAQSYLSHRLLGVQQILSRRPAARNRLIIQAISRRMRLPNALDIRGIPFRRSAKNKAASKAAACKKAFLKSRIQISHFPLAPREVARR